MTPYLAKNTVLSTLRFVASFPLGTGIVFDYGLEPSSLNPFQRFAFDALERRVALAGEPWQTFFRPADLKEKLSAMGFGSLEDLGPEETNARYFRDRTDGLRVGSLAHLTSAIVGPSRP